jgi:hypothetical protein
MKSNAIACERDDRVSTREELNLVVGLMADLHEVPLEAALEFLEKRDAPNPGDLELWIDGTGEDRPSRGIEALVGIVISRPDRLN